MEHHSLLFFIVFVAIILYVAIQQNLMLPVAATFGGFCGSTIQKPHYYKNVLIVDVANMFTGWYMEKYCKKKVPYMKQPERVRKYLECCSDHYKHFSKHNTTDGVNYVIKNFRHTHAVGKTTYDTYMPEFSEDDWNLCHNFVNINKNALISLAVDYRVVPYHKWKDKKMHYLRGRDDYLCFKLAQDYKKKYVNAVIMSDDKYRDFSQFGFVPEFRAYCIGKPDTTKNINHTSIAVQTSETIRPVSNGLGQIRDYNLIKITLAFTFDDPKFMKTSDYKVETPGHVWA